MVFHLCLLNYLNDCYSILLIFKFKPTEFIINIYTMAMNTILFNSNNSGNICKSTNHLNYCDDLDIKQHALSEIEHYFNKSDNLNNIQSQERSYRLSQVKRSVEKSHKWSALNIRPFSLDSNTSSTSSTNFNSNNNSNIYTNENSSLELSKENYSESSNLDAIRNFSVNSFMSAASSTEKECSSSSSNDNTNDLASLELKLTANIIYDIMKLKDEKKKSEISTISTNNPFINTFINTNINISSSVSIKKNTDSLGNSGNSNYSNSTKCFSNYVDMNRASTNASNYSNNISNKRKTITAWNLYEITQAITEEKEGENSD